MSVASVRVRHAASPRLAMISGCLLSLGLVLSAPGCSKKNELDSSGQGSCGESSDCDGACVEGVCRPACSPQYTCEGDATCQLVDDVPACIPPGVRVYAPYEPLDLLKDCTTPEGCDVNLDALGLEGNFSECLGGDVFHRTDAENPDFDFAGACSGDLLDAFYVKGRTAFRMNDGKCSEERTIGLAGSDTVVQSCHEWDSPERMNLELSKLVRTADGGIYLWTNGGQPSPYPQPDGSYIEPSYWLLKFNPGTAPSGAGGECHTKSDCSLPHVSRVGAAASQFAGLWVECDTSDPASCDATWDAPLDQNRTRLVYFIREDGFGQISVKAGDALAPDAAFCNFAFRITGQNELLSLGRGEGPVAHLQVNQEQLQVLSVPEGEFLGLPLSSSVRFKKVPLPTDFEDPCDASQPSFAL